MEEKPVFFKVRIQDPNRTYRTKNRTLSGLILIEDFHKLSVDQKIFKIGPYLTELETLKEIYAMAVVTSANSFDDIKKTEYFKEKYAIHIRGVVNFLKLG